MNGINAHIRVDDHSHASITNNRNGVVHNGNGVNGGRASSTSAEMQPSSSSSSSSLLGGIRSSSQALSRSHSGGGHQRGVSSQMFVAPGPIITGATQSVHDYRKRKVALITGKCESSVKYSMMERACRIGSRV